MHYLITGGTGLIGSSLCQHLLTSGNDVTVLSRDRQKVYNLFSDKVKAVESLDGIDQKHAVDIVINLAGEPIANKKWSEKQKTILEKSRIDLTRNLVNWIKSLQQKPHTLISGSAVGWYGDQGAQPLTEDSGYKSDYAHELCEKWEQAALAAPDDIRVCIIRTGLVLSMDGGVLQRLLLPFKLGFGCTLGDGHQFMPWIHITDIVQLIIYISLNPSATGVFNATAPHPVTNKTFTHTLAKQLHRPTFLKAPESILKFALGEMSQLLLGGQKAYPEKAKEIGYQFQYTELDSAFYNLLNRP